MLSYRTTFTLVAVGAIGVAAWYFLRAQKPAEKQAMPIAQVQSVATPVSAVDDLSAVKARMSQRLAAIIALRKRQITGENNLGFLELRAVANKEEETVVLDENTDRRIVYTALATQTKNKPEHVGRVRARQIADLCKRGDWVQDSSGAWYQKP